MTIYDNTPDMVRRDILNLFLGEYLGEGVGRRVYRYAPDDRYVVKLEYARQSFQNVLEWSTWCEVKETRWAKWFAPCFMISECGMVMLQERTEPVPQAVDLDHIPNFLTDTKRENWGMLEGRPVVHDYGYHDLTEMGLNHARLKKRR